MFTGRSKRYVNKNIIPTYLCNLGALCTKAFGVIDKLLYNVCGVSIAIVCVLCLKRSAGLEGGKTLTGPHI